MPSDYIIVESSGTPLLEQVMVFVIKTIGKSTSEITAILSSLPSAAMGGSVAIAEDASAAWMKGLDGTWGKIGSDAGGLPAGGTAGQYIKKLSATYGDAEWETPDTTPTSNSTKLITSGGVFDSVATRFGGSTTDVKASALALINDGFYTFTGAGSSYTGDAPTTSNKYGSFAVHKRGTDRVVLSFYDDVVYICYYRNSAWSKWYPVDAYAMAMLGYYVYGSSATYSIPKDSYVIWNNVLYKSTTAIGAGVDFGSTNLTTVPGGGLNELKNRIMYGEASTPSDHTHYIDISRSSYNYIIACIKSNANYNICAYPYSGSAFRVIIRSPDGSLPTSPVEITFALFK